MPSTLAHAASASLVAITFAHIRPTETSYILVAVVSASILDLDHLVYAIRDRDMYRAMGYRGNLHRARSIFHELFGLLTAGVLAGLLFLVDPRLARVVFVAFTVHLTQDWLLGQSSPFAPVDDTPIRFFSPTFREKVMIDLVILAVSGVLWIMFLAGAP
jgi:hypothetical protein